MERLELGDTSLTQEIERGSERGRGTQMRKTQGDPT